MGRRLPDRYLLYGATALLAFLVLNEGLEVGVWTGPPEVEPSPATADVTPVPPPALYLDSEGCLRVRARVDISEPEAPDRTRWQSVRASGARLREDACGSVWALWFNSWEVFDRGDPSRRGQVNLPAGDHMARLAGAGVADFLVRPNGELWLLGRSGLTGRYRQAAWESLGPIGSVGRGCADFAGTIWCAAGSAAPGPAIHFWDEASDGRGKWLPAGGLRGSVTFLLASPWDSLIAAGESEVLEYASGPEAGGWIPRSQGGPGSTALAAGEDRIYVGTADGLQVIAPDGARVLHALGGAVTGLIPRPGGRVWAAVRGAGLRYLDGERWHSWRFAQGLPSDDASDLLLARDGRLWVAGSPMGVIDIAAAEQRILTLSSPDPIPGETFEDACEAAKRSLGRRSWSGQIARATLGGRALVFFSGRQACPFPSSPDAMHAFRRRADGAILRVPGGAGIACGSPCTGESVGMLRARWTFELHRPSAPGLGGPFEVEVIPPPEPVPPESPTGIMLLDMGSDVWVATRDAGVYRHDGERWHVYGAESGFPPGNPVADILEDDNGRIWIATRPAYSRERGAHAGASLHRFEAGAWRHWSPDEALAHWSANALAAIPGGVAVGTNGGLSLVIDRDVRSFEHESMHDRVYVSSVVGDASRYLWLAHGPFAEGITWFDHGTFRHLTSRDGLFADRIERIAHDEAGRVWLLAADGRVGLYSRFALMDRTPR